MLWFIICNLSFIKMRFVILEVGLAHAFWQAVGENNDEDNC
jgi:hypothetical protein